MLCSPEPCRRAQQCTDGNPSDPASRRFGVRVKFEAQMAGTVDHTGGRAEARILKAGAKRTVLLSQAETGPARVVKRFHSPGVGGHRLLWALGDRRRATLEARALRRAGAVGLPVPSPGSVSRSPGGGWEFSMAAIPGARTLSEVLRAAFGELDGLPQLELRQLAERLGLLLRQVESAGFLHADPHPANVIVDPSGELHIVDLARSRVGRHHGAVRRGLLHALSRLREECPRAFRRRVAAAWLGTNATPEWTRRVEGEATALRIRELEDRVRVWLRTSSATEVRSGFDDRGVAVWVRDCPSEAPPGWITRRVAGSAEGTGQIWSTLVRAKLHRIPACEPRALALEAPHAVEYDQPRSAEPLAPGELRRAEERLARSGLRAVTSQGDRGPFTSGPDGAALVAPHARLEALGEPSDGCHP